jgi:hypothetical protein
MSAGSMFRRGLPRNVKISGNCLRRSLAGSFYLPTNQEAAGSSPV